jgi:hypothetical protein
MEPAHHIPKAEFAMHAVAVAVVETQKRERRATLMADAALEVDEGSMQK